MEIWIVLIIFLGAAVLFVTEKFPIDQVALMVLAALLVTGILNPEEAISGFSNPATVTVAAMLVISGGLQQTGALTVVGNLFVRIGQRPVLFTCSIMVIAAAVSAFINNTAAVAVFLPIVLAAAAKNRIAPSRLLIPLSFASQFGGVCTLIGTSTNLLVSSISDQAGYGAFSMFEFSKLGLIMCGAGVLYLLVAGYWLLPNRGADALTEAYGLGGYLTELRVLEDSPLVGQTLREVALRENHDATVVAVLRGEKKIWAFHSLVLEAGDLLLVQGKVDDLMRVKDKMKLEIEPELKVEDETLKSGDVALVEVLVAPRSRLIGETLVTADFSRRFRLLVLAIRRRGQNLRLKLGRVRLDFGDELLLQGAADDVEKLRRNPDFIVLDEHEKPEVRKRKLPISILITVGVVGVAAWGGMSILGTSLIGCVALLLTRCLRLQDAYSAVDWRVIFLLAGLLPLGLAMQKTGAAELVAGKAIDLVGGMGPYAVLAVFYIMTAILTEAMSNNAAAVLLAPIASSTAVQLGMDPKPLLMAVTFAASTSFATPVGYQTNAMIYNPGKYRYTDFLRIGVPLNLIFLALAVYFIPKFWPF